MFISFLSTKHLHRLAFFTDLSDEAWAKVDYRSLRNQIKMKNQNARTQEIKNRPLTFHFTLTYFTDYRLPVFIPSPYNPDPAITASPSSVNLLATQSRDPSLNHRHRIGTLVS